MKEYVVLESDLSSPAESDNNSFIKTFDESSEGGSSQELKAGSPGGRRTPLARLLGISLVLCSSFLFSGSATGAKYLHHISPGEFLLVRGGYALVLLLPSSLYTGNSLFSFPRKRLVAARCLTHGAGYCLKIWCVKNMKLGDAISLYCTSIIFAGAFARAFLKEKYTLVNAVSICSGLAGVILIAKPSFVFTTPSHLVSCNPYYALIALAAACCSGAGYCVQRAVGTAVASSVTTFYTNLSVMVGGVVLNFATGDTYSLPLCYVDRYILTGCGVGACLGLVMLNWGLSIEKSAPATLMRNMDIVIAFLVQIFLFREHVDLVSVGGATLILLSTVSVTLEKALCPRYFCRI